MKQNITYLLVQLDLLDVLVERDDLLAVVDHHPVPGVDLSRLVQEHLNERINRLIN